MSEQPPLRLFVDAPLGAGPLALDKDQSHYLVNVMRRQAGDPVLLFNGRDGEWRAEIAAASKRAVTLDLLEQTRPQSAEPDVWLLFAPLKKDRTDFVIEKATELGAARILPVISARTQTGRVNVDRLTATAREAAEQSRRLSVPDVTEVAPLSETLSAWPGGRTLIYMDETGGGAPLLKAIAAHPGPLAFLIGPEGGFAPDELDLMRKLPFSVAADLGPRILRAETAAVAALSIRQAAADAAS